MTRAILFALALAACGGTVVVSSDASSSSGGGAGFAGDETTTIATGTSGAGGAAPNCHELIGAANYCVVSGHADHPLAYQCEHAPDPSHCVIVAAATVVYCCDEAQQ